MLEVIEGEQQGAVADKGDEGRLGVVAVGVEARCEQRCKVGVVVERSELDEDSTVGEVWGKGRRCGEG